MEKRKNRGKLIIYIACFAVIIGLSLFLYRIIKNGEAWAFYQTNRHVYTEGEMTNIGNITDRDGNVLAYTSDGKRLYNDDRNIRKATIHAVGDSEGYISAGVQNALREKLTGYSLTDGFYKNNSQGNDASLTIDSAVSVAAMKALGNNSGCVGICNYKTGEMICMVSMPTFDVADISSFSSAKSGELGAVFVNKFISSVYTPGSTFKIVTAAAALDTYGDEAYEKEFTCEYGTVIEEESLSCLGRHSVISLNKAFTNSCNAYFAGLGLSLGKNKMLQHAEIFGFNKEFYIDGIKTAKASFNIKEADNIDVAWASIGQYTNLMNPLQFLCGISAIANGGEYVTPYFVESITDQNGKAVYSSSKKKVRLLSEQTANKLYDLMDLAVKDNYGKGSFGELDICGKTGTAEVGQGVENSLFVGFSKDKNLPLAFVVVVEGGGSGRSSAMSVANWALQAAKQTLN